MNFWMVVAIAGTIFTIAGFILFVMRYSVKIPIKTSVLLVGIFIPILATLSFAETLISEFFPKLTLLDLGAFYLAGMISGFFMALFLFYYKILIKENNL